MTTCIVVDDDINTTQVLSELLEFMGLDVVAKGYGGKEAVMLYKKYRPDISFIDILMPVNDGFYAIRNIREFDPRAKIIVVTSDNSKDTQQKLDEMKITELIYKPYQHTQIVQMLEKHQMHVHKS